MMGAKITRIISTRIQNARRRIKVLINGSRDTQEVYESTAFGEDSNIPNGYRGIYMPTGEKGRSVLVGVININQVEDLSKGEKKVYSTDDEGGAVQAFIIMRNDGSLEINGVGDNAVRFTPLDTELQNFVSFINTELTKIQAGLAGVGGSYTPGNAIIDISQSRVDNVNLPS